MNYEEAGLGPESPGEPPEPVSPHLEVFWRRLNLMADEIDRSRGYVLIRGSARTGRTVVARLMDTDVIGCISASDRGYEAFFRESYPELLRGPLRLCPDATLAEEIAQEAFIQALRHWPRVRVMANPYGWVKVTAVRLAWKTLQKEAQQRGHQQVEDLCTVSAAASIDVPLWVDLDNALKALPPRQRAVATLRFLVDLTPQEIADVLDIAPGTVRAHLHAAGKALRRRLGPDMEGQRS